MSLPRYPAYQDSKLEWAKTFPEHWAAKHLKRNVRLLTEKTDTRECPVGLENLEGWTGRFIQTESDFEGEGVGFKADDILFGKLRPYLAKVWLADRRGEAIGDFHVLRPFECVIPRFIQYQLLTREVVDLVDGSTYGAKMPRASWGFLGCLELPTPPAEEQLAITNFLDRETAKIDALIAEQQRLIELLQEKRQAVISHAVTKGLNPNAPMKVSGVEWLGEVPEPWRVMPLRWAAKCCSGDGLSSTEISSTGDDEYTVPVIGGNGLMGYTNQAKTNYSLLAIGRVGALCGNVHIVHPPAWITDNALVLDPDSSIFDLGFLSLTLRSRNLNDIASKTAQPLITGTQVGDQRIPCPPLSEQHLIASHLMQQSEQFDTLSTEAQRAIVLLQERRSALISAAVTGQIDVRGLALEGAA
jgi:type I restriction enzyme, S subunit